MRACAGVAAVSVSRGVDGWTRETPTYHWSGSSHETERRKTGPAKGRWVSATRPGLPTGRAAGASPRAPRRQAPPHSADLPRAGWPNAPTRDSTRNLTTPAFRQRADRCRRGRGCTRRTRCGATEPRPRRMHAVYACSPGSDMQACGLNPAGVLKQVASHRRYGAVDRYRRLVSGGGRRRRRARGRRPNALQARALEARGSASSSTVSASVICGEGMLEPWSPAAVPDCFFQPQQ